MGSRWRSRQNCTDQISEIFIMWKDVLYKINENGSWTIWKQFTCFSSELWYMGCGPSCAATYNYILKLYAIISIRIWINKLQLCLSICTHILENPFASASSVCATQNCHLFHCHRELFVIDTNLTTNNHLTSGGHTCPEPWSRFQKKHKGMVN